MASDSLKVLIDARMVSGRLHGIGRYTVNLIRGLAQKGIKPKILANSIETVKVIGKENIADAFLCQYPFAHPLESLELTYRTFKNAYDIVHFPSFAVPAICPSNAVITLHDVMHIYPPSSLKYQIYYQTVLKSGLKSCAKVLTVSEWSRQEIVKTFGISKDKISVVRNGLEQDWFKEHVVDQKAFQDPVTKQDLSGPYFICISNLKPHKNVQTLIQACRSLWNKSEDFKLALAVGANELPEAWNISPEERKKIFLLNHVSEETLKQAILKSKALVAPSYYEGFDYPVAEALALGKNVILSTGSAHDEFQSEALTFYSPSNNVSALAECLVTSLNSLTLNAKFAHNVHTCDQTTEDTLKVYKSILPKHF